MPLVSTGFLTQLYSLWKPSWLTSQPFLQFILNYRNHPNLAAPVHHTRGTHKKQPHRQSSRFWIKVSSLTGLYTADCSEETKQQESNETVSYRQFSTILIIVTTQIGRELFWFLDDRPHSCKNINFSHSLIHCLFLISFLYHIVILLLTDGTDMHHFRFQGLTLGHYTSLDPHQARNHWAGILSLG